MKLVVIIPAYNEAKTIATVINKIPRDLAGVDQVEVVVINDGSTDQTAKLAQEAGAVVVSLKQNQGVGGAFTVGMKEALRRKANVIVNIDADGQFNPQDISKLASPILQGKADFVTCSRFKEKDLVPKMPALKKFGNKLMVKIINFITKQKFTDVSCGFRAYSQEAAMRLNLFGVFTYTQESFIDLAKKGLVMKEVPCKVRGVREHGKSRVANNLFTYGWKTTAIIVRALRDYKPLKFFGAIGSVIFLMGVAIITFVFVHWCQTGGTSPYQSLIIVGAVALILGFLLWILALVADMLGRQRNIQEEVLYYQKKRLYER
ncbi:MAG: glycosyltransferase family 2 protein [Parcubacteria group bacterium]|nr:glycosyltransferase family 2 protein [Parcubacteria group bacterium]